MKIRRSSESRGEESSVCTGSESSFGLSLEEVLCSLAVRISFGRFHTVHPLSLAWLVVHSSTGQLTLLC